MSARSAATATLLLLVAALASALAIIRPPHARAPTSQLPRVVVLSPALAVTLKDLGYAHTIVGRHAFDVGVATDAPVCGDQTHIDTQTILALRPTHIFLEWGQRAPPEPLSSLARRHRWTILDCSQRSLDDVARAAQTLDDALSPLASPLGRTIGPDPSDWFKRHTSRPPGSLAHAGRVLLLHNANPPMALGRGSAHDELLRRLGATPALDRSSPSTQLDLESIIRLDPDTIVLLDPDPDAPAVRSGRDAAPALHPLSSLDIPAVRQGRIHVIADPHALLPSTALARLADLIADTLAPPDAPDTSP